MNQQPVCPDCGRPDVPLRRDGRIQRHRKAIVTKTGIALAEAQCDAIDIRPDWQQPTINAIRRPLTPTFSHPRKPRRPSPETTP